MTGNFIEFVDMGGSTGKYMYITVNTNPEEQVSIDDVIPGCDDSSEDEFMAQVIAYEHNETKSLNNDITNSIFNDNIDASDIVCYYGILYTGNEFPKDECGIESPDIVMLLTSEGIYGSFNNGVVMVKEFSAYDGKNIAEHINDSMDYVNSGYSLDGDNFFIFVGNIKHISCYIEE